MLAAWKESGGFAGTFSPNAAFVETVYPMSAGTTYTVQVVWKTNWAAIGATIAAGAGPIGSDFSPTRLTADVLPSGYQSAVSSAQYTLSSSDGGTWHPIDPTQLVTGTFSPSVNEDVVVSGNADLWTSTAGYNQDLGIEVSVDGAPPVLVAWKEFGRVRGDLLAQRRLRPDGVPAGSKPHLRLLAVVEDQQAGGGGDHLRRGGAAGDRLLADPPHRRPADVRFAAQRPPDSWRRWP